MLSLELFFIVCNNLETRLIFKILKFITFKSKQIKYLNIKRFNSILITSFVLKDHQKECR